MSFPDFKVPLTEVLTPLQELEAYLLGPTFVLDRSGLFISTGPIIIGADSDATGTDGITLKTRNIARFTVNNDGTLTATGRVLTLGDVTQTDAAKIELKTQSTILLALSTQTFNFVGSGPGGASYANHTFGLHYNVAEVAGDPTFSLSFEPKFSQGGNPYQTEIYYSWEDPTHSFSLRPWGMVIQHATGDNSFTVQGEIVYLENLSSGSAQTAIWHESGYLEFTNGSAAQIQFPNNAPSLVGYNAAVTSTIGMIKIDTSDRVAVAYGGQNIVLGGPTSVGSLTDVSTISGASDADTLIQFAGSDVIYLKSGGNFPLTIEPGDVRLQTHFIFDGDNTYDIGIVSGTNKRPRDIKAGRDIYAAGTIYPGAILMANTVQLQWKDSGAVTRSVLQMYTDDVYLDSAPGHLIFRTGSGAERWRMNSSGHLLAGADNTYDIGASGATRPRNVFIAGNVTIGDNAALIKSSVAMANGAGAGAGTLTNAPAAGNPTKWIGINDNGTMRYIPTW